MKVKTEELKTYLSNKIGVIAMTDNVRYIDIYRVYSGLLLLLVEMERANTKARVHYESGIILLLRGLNLEKFIDTDN